MENQSTLDAALRYAELGYPVFPCAPNAKRPLTKNGLLDATLDAAQIEAWFTEHSRANIGLVTDGLLVLDLDAMDDGTPNPWLLTIDPEKAHGLAGCPLSTTPRGGRHYVFRAPAGKTFRNSNNKLAKKVDTRADGGYILVEPSMVEGKPYRWTTAETLADTPREQLPEPPAWLVDALERSSSSGNLDSVRIDHAQPGNAIPAGQRNSTLTSLAGAMRRVGMSRDEMLAALRTTNAHRCKPPLPDKDVEIIAWSVARYEPDQVAVAVAEDHAAQDGLAAEPAEVGPVDPGQFPAELIRVPGFIDEVVDFNLAGAFKPQPILALAGALCLLATLTGRKVRDAAGTRTNLYCIGVGETASGKDRARVVNKDILHLADLDRMIGPESIGSSSGLVNVVEENPAILLQLDEIGRYLRTLGDAKQSYLFNIITVMMRMFTSSASIYVGDALADTKRVRTIYQPHLCVYGTTVPQSLLESLTLENLTDGFLSRCLIFEGTDTERQRPDPADVPRALVEQAAWWGQFAPGGNLSGKTPQPIIVPTTPDAETWFMDFETLADAEQKRLGNPLGPLWSRGVEVARKLGLLWACSADRERPNVDLQAAQWATSMIGYLTRRTIFLASRWVSSSVYDAKVKRLLRLIEAAGPDGATKTRINNNTGLPMRERAEILTDLVSRGLIRCLEEKTETKPITRYVASRFLADVA